MPHTKQPRHNYPMKSTLIVELYNCNYMDIFLRQCFVSNVACNSDRGLTQFQAIQLGNVELAPVTVD